MLSQEEIDAKLEEIRDVLWNYNLENKEEFRLQVDEIPVENKGELYRLRNALEDAKALANMVRAFGDEKTKEKIKSIKPGDLPKLCNEVNRRIEHFNLLEGTDHKDEVAALVREALAEIEFSFRKIGEEELKIVINDLRDRYNKVKNEFESNFDKVEEKYVTLSSQFREFFRKRNLTPQNVVEAKEDIQYMDSVMLKIREINRRNRQLKAAYKDDEKFVRIHKRIVEANEKRQIPPDKPIISEKERIICENLIQVKKMVDDSIYYNVQILHNKPVFDDGIMSSVTNLLFDMNIKASREDRMFIRKQISDEYMNTYLQA